MARNTAPTTNPLRGWYLLVGSDLVRAGVRAVSETARIFAREDNGEPIDVVDPATERWLSSRAVTRAAALAGIELNMAAMPASLVVPFVQSDPRAKIRNTEEAIVSLLGGDNPVNRAFAIKEVELLETTYAAAAQSQAA